MVTLKDVAREAGCSEATASLVINNKPGVHESTRKKVLIAVSKLGYEPNTFARSLASKKSKTIGLLVTDIENPFFGSLVHHISQNVRHHGYALIVTTSNDDSKLEQEALQSFLSRRVDGLIAVPTQQSVEDRAAYASFITRRIPLVFTTSYYLQVPADRVLTDYAQGSYALTSHLLSFGHRSIVLLIGSDQQAPINRDRIRGAREAYEEQHLDPSLLQLVACDQPTFADGYKTTIRLLTENDRPDAIMAINDVIALGAKKAVENMNLRVPQDISIGGYDDVIYASLLETPLTTVRQNIPAIAQASVETLLKRIQAPDRPLETILLAPELIVRKTTKAK